MPYTLRTLSCNTRFGKTLNRHGFVVETSYTLSTQHTTGRAQVFYAHNNTVRLLIQQTRGVVYAGLSARFDRWANSREVVIEGLSNRVETLEHALHAIQHWIDAGAPRENDFEERSLNTPMDPTWSKALLALPFEPTNIKRQALWWDRSSTRSETLACQGVVVQCVETLQDPDSDLHPRRFCVRLLRHPDLSTDEIQALGFLATNLPLGLLSLRETLAELFLQPHSPESLQRAMGSALILAGVDQPLDVHLPRVSGQSMRAYSGGMSVAVGFVLDPFITPMAHCLVPTESGGWTPIDHLTIPVPASHHQRLQWLTASRS